MRKMVTHSFGKRNFIPGPVLGPMPNILKIIADGPINMAPLNKIKKKL
jgi:hypothetical protein